MAGKAQDDRARREAAEWFALLNNRTVTTASLMDFRAWRQASEENDRAYLEVDTIWRRANGLHYDHEIIKAIVETKARRRGLGWVWRPPGPSRSAPIIAGVAALAAAAVGFQLWISRGAYETAVGEQLLVRLDDGSRLRLDTGSRVRVRFSGAARRVELVRGQAFFEVAHDAQGRPFEVVADKAEVRVLGTRFDVRRDTAGVQVTLVEGKVEVVSAEAEGTERAHRQVLEPGQQLNISRTAGLGAPRSVDAAAATSWTSGRLVFRGQRLAAAIAEVNRYERKGVVLNAPELADTPVSGAFDAGDTDAFAAAVADLYDLVIERRSDGAVVLTRRPAS